MLSNTEGAREARVRRALDRAGYRLEKQRGEHLNGYGRYQIVEVRTNTLVDSGDTIQYVEEVSRERYSPEATSA